MWRDSCICPYCLSPPQPLTIVKSPLVSIITPTLDDGPALRRTVASIDSQSWKPVEHIIVNGAGSETELPSGSSSSRRILNTSPRGVYDAVNHGLRACTGDIIGILNGNDRLASPDVLARIVEEFNQTGTDFVYGHVYYSDSSGNITRRYRSDRYRIDDLLHGFAPPHPSLYISRRTLERVGFYDCSYVTAADFDMFVRLFSEPSLKGRLLDMYFAEMSCGGLSGNWRNRLLTNPRERLKSLRSHGFRTGPFSLLPRYFRLFKEYLK